MQTAEKTFQTMQKDFSRVLDVCMTSLSNGGKLLFFGNGGSAADAQHLATELTVRYMKDRKPIRAIALTTDTSALTAIGNDFGYEFVFSRQLEAVGRAGDVLVGISTSGRSKNVIAAFKSAKAAGITTIAMTGAARCGVKGWRSTSPAGPNTCRAACATGSRPS